MKSEQIEPLTMEALRRKWALEKWADWELLELTEILARLLG
jgi:hypothetical protein